MLANMLNFFKNLHILYIAKFGPNTSFYGWLPLELHHKIENERKTLQPAWGGSLIPWHKCSDQWCRICRCENSPKQILPNLKRESKEPNKTSLWRSSIGPNCSLWHFLGCGGFDLCRVWSIDNHKIREARKALSQSGEYLKNMFQEWQMVKIGGIASKLWQPMMWKMDTGSQNDENLNDFIKSFAKTWELKLTLQPSMTNHPFIYEFGSCLVT